MSSLHPGDAYTAARGRIASMLEIFKQAATYSRAEWLAEKVEAGEAANNTSRAEYEQMVRDGKEFIAAGDIFQFCSQPAI